MAQQLSILHVVDSLEVGGLERVVTDLALAQKQRGHRVGVFSICATGGFLGELREAGIEVRIGGKQRGFDFNVLGELRRAVMERDIRLVHAHNFTPNYYAATALLATPGRRTLVGTSHNMGTRLSNRRLRWIYRMSLMRTARVAMVSREVHERYVSAGWVKARQAETVLNGIPVKRFAPSEERRAEARRRLGVPPERFVIGCVGRLVPLKNHKMAIEVLARLLPQHPEAELVIVGEGPLESALRAQATEQGVADRVRLLGRRSDVADLLPGFDVFALPSHSEGLSVALLEACATGLPIVCTSVGGNVEIVRDGQTGLLVPPNDPTALRDAFARLIQDTPLRRRLGAAAATWVSAHASIDALATAYDRFYERAL